MNAKPTVSVQRQEMLVTEHSDVKAGGAACTGMDINEPVAQQANKVRKPNGLPD